MERVLRTISDGLALMFGFNPRQRAVAVGLAVAGLVTLNWFSSASLIVLSGKADWKSLELWFGLAGLPSVFLLFVVFSARAWQVQSPARSNPLTTDSRPTPSPGLVLFLSTFTTFADKLPEGRRGQVWKGDDLLEALNRPDCDWPCVLDHVQASNMQVPFYAR